MELVFVGDLILDAPDPGSFFASCREAIAGDVAVAQVEWPHTNRGQVCAFEVPAPAAPLENLAAGGHVEAEPGQVRERRPRCGRSSVEPEDRAGAGLLSGELDEGQALGSTSPAAPSDTPTASRSDRAAAASTSGGTSSGPTAAT